MQYCEPRYEDRLVDELLRFINANFNEPSLAYFIGQRGAIFVDPYPSICERRMLARGTGGDAYRGRLRGYAVTQAIAYYMVARLFGWKVFCVPYTETSSSSSPSSFSSLSRQFQPSKYKEIANYLVQEYFGLPNANNPVPKTRYDRPQNVYIPDMEYAKAVGIFK